MVAKKRILNRLAFTMIELIFAIVIIAISVISLPMMTQVSSSAMEDNLVQEAIFASAAEINLATTFIWDENSRIDDNDTNSTGFDLSRVINLNSECAGTGVVVAGVEVNARVGHVHRRCLDNLNTRRYLGVDFQDSLERTAHAYAPIYIGTEASGYKKEYDSELLVIECDTGNCQDFGLEVDNINLKEIRVTIREKDDATNSAVTLLRTYSANIGEVANARKFL